MDIDLRSLIARWVATRRAWPVGSLFRREPVRSDPGRRQRPIGPYIADFVCLEVSLIIEVDGGQHAEQIKEDEARTRFLEKAGFRVIRFWNNDVLANTDGVLEAIFHELQIPSQDRC